MIKRLLHFVCVLNRAQRIAKYAREYYNSAVYYCCGVSHVNNDLAFLIERIGIFGGPVITQITRPDQVTIGEFENVVVVKDGFLYELKKTNQ